MTYGAMYDDGEDGWDPFEPDPDCDCDIHDTHAECDADGHCEEY